MEFVRRQTANSQNATEKPTPTPPNTNPFKCSVEPCSSTISVTPTTGPSVSPSITSHITHPVGPNPTTPFIAPQSSLGSNSTASDGKNIDAPRTSNRLSGGAVAGVAIAMLFVGLLIAGAVFFFLLRRQKKKRYESVQNSPPHHTLAGGAVAMLEKGPTAVTTGSAYATNIDDMLPQPVADDTITDAALKIRDSIKNHVRTYYHLSVVPVARINQANMGELAIATGTSSAMLASMLSDTSTRAETLRLILAWIMLSRCTGERNESLLPGELAMIDMAIPGKDGNNAAQSAMYSKWKTVTGTLLHERISQNAQDPDRKQRFASAVADLDFIVAPFVQSGLEAQRSKNLDMILTRSANFAFLLFSQPGTFRFEFSNVHGGLVVFPGLVQTIGDQGQVLGPSRVLLEKELAA
ncbi:hypothetical protein G6011_02012 [Alternaria panax]|uniref:Uncharacterized protein n=1 Tax=Alternaria panax TaxID=48097 RepID=A0AAD4FIB3_9PLEO|nr:hypothetical protein G6011_02012 [Alternaria panax]